MLVVRVNLPRANCQCIFACRNNLGLRLKTTAHQITRISDPYLYTQTHAYIFIIYEYWLDRSANISFAILSSLIFTVGAYSVWPQYFDSTILSRCRLIPSRSMAFLAISFYLNSIFAIIFHIFFHSLPFSVLSFNFSFDSIFTRAFFFTFKELPFFFF